MNAKTTVERNPFPGLRPFREDEEYLFFGRENQVDAMVDKLAATRFLAVVGGSGSGKSSLVNCGLRPALHGGLMSRAGTEWRMAQFRPGSDPIGEMARALAEDGVLFSDFKAEGMRLTEILGTTLRMSTLGLIDSYEQAKLNEGENLLVVVDQFEELFRYRQLGAGEQDEHYGVSEEATAFVNLLLEIKEQTKYPIYVVLTMRSDFLGDCAQFTGLAEAINEGQYLVPRMTRDERRAAISMPVGVCGAEISPVLLTRLVNDVGDNPDQLSILQHALNRTWASWQREAGAGGPLDLPHYEAIGTMDHALDHHAEEAYAELGSERSRYVCEKIFKALTDKATDPRGVRRPTTLGNLCTLADASEAEVLEVIEVFRHPSRSFLMPPAGITLQANTVVDISHESLMRVWQRLNDWADEEALSARTYRRLAETSELHMEGGAGLWKDPDLQLALKWKEHNQPNEAWARRYHPEFESAMGFLKKSKAARGRRRALMLGTAAAVFIILSGLYVRATIYESIAVRSQKKAEVEKSKAEKSAAAARVAQKQADSSARRAASAAKQAESAKKSALESAEREKYAATIANEQKEIAVRAQRRADASAAAEKIQKRSALESARIATIAKGDAENQRDIADNAKKSTDRLLYDSNMFLAQQDISDGRMEHARELLQASLLEPHQINFRGFEWYYLWGQIYTEKATLSGGSGVLAAAYTWDGKTLASGSRDGKVRLWDPSTQQELSTLKGHKAAVNSVAFSPDGETLATGSRDNTVKLWNVANPKQPKELATLEGHDKWVWSVAFSPDGKTLATGNRSGKVRLWDLKKREAVTMEAHSEKVTSVVFAPDGKTLATGSGDKTVKLWDLTTLKALKQLKGHTKAVMSVAFAPDGNTLASGSEDKTVRIWDIGTQKEETTAEILVGHSELVQSVAFSPDGKTLATGSWDRSVKLWDLATYRELATLSDYGFFVYPVAFAPDGKTLATGANNGMVKLWDMTSPKKSPTLSGCAGDVNLVAFSPDGKMLATASGDRDTKIGDKTVKIWDVESPTATPKVFEGHTKTVNSAAFSPDGKTLATGSADKTVKLWNVDSPTAKPKELSIADSVSTVAFSPDGTILAVGARDDNVTMWDLTDPDSPKPLKPLTGHKGNVWSVAFASDGKTLASGSQDKTVRLWDLAEPGQPKELAILEGHKDDVRSVAFSPDGKTLATGSDEAVVKLWDAKTFRELKTLKGHSDRVWSVAFSPDGKTLASGSRDHTVKLWDPASYRELATLIGTHTVLTVTFSPDGKTLAAGNAGDYVKLYFAATEEEIAAQRSR